MESYRRSFSENIFKKTGISEETIFFKRFQFSQKVDSERFHSERFHQHCLINPNAHLHEAIARVIAIKSVVEFRGILNLAFCRSCRCT
jgi:hypothetical protein